jgi:Mrp family chromosome partitioning ATPase
VDIFPVVTPRENAHEILARTAVGALMRNLGQSYEVVILDTPPVLAVPDVSLVLPHVEACITVARAGATPLAAFRAMLELIPREKIAGAFINGVSRGRDFQQYDYYSGAGNGGKNDE